MIRTSAIGTWSFALATLAALVPGTVSAADPAPAPSATAPSKAAPASPAPSKTAPASATRAPAAPSKAASVEPAASGQPLVAASATAPAPAGTPARTPPPAPAGGAAPRTGTTPPRTGSAAPRTVAVAPTGVLREPAPRPVTDVRVQSRFATKAKTGQLFAAAEYLSRGDYYNSPGARIGGAYYPYESIGLELLISHDWSSLNDSAERVKAELGYLPDSHAPAWRFLAGGRYSIGYGKLMVGGLGGAIHFEPQAFVHAGLHAYDGDVGPSTDFGLGLLVFLTPKMFTRIDAAIVYERETRSGNAVGVWGTLPSLAVGGTL
jgi:hypothetical protein